jgi:pilus assembly protein Flp/PilA
MEVWAFTGQVAGFLAEESGQDLVEYALLAALVGIGAVVSIKGLATKIGTALSSIGTTLTTNV